MNFNDWLKNCPHEDIKLLKTDTWGKTIGICQNCGKVFEYNPADLEGDYWDSISEDYKRPDETKRKKLFELCHQEYIKETNIIILKKLAEELNRRYFLKNCRLEFNEDNVIFSFKGSLHVEVLDEVKRLCSEELGAVFNGELILKQYGNNLKVSNIYNDNRKKFILNYKNNNEAQP
jgi:hypothetical protein